VYLSATGPVTIEDPFVSTDMALPDTTSADITFNVTLRNHSSKDVKGILSAAFGKLHFEQPVTLVASEMKNIHLTSADYPSLKLKNPKLWWPNGYGPQNLYDVEITFTASDGVLSDLKKFQTGIRKMS
jgi:beta-galactosidase/beta-glucuronidase